MKTWNEIEQRLKTENQRDEMPAGLHDQILRAVRDDRAAVSSAGRTHHYAAYWLMGGALATAIVGMTTILFLPPFRAVQPSATPSAPSISLAGFETMATSPIRNEVEALRTDFASAARFLADYIPGSPSGG